MRRHDFSQQLVASRTFYSNQSASGGAAYRTDWVSILVGRAV